MTSQRIKNSIISKLIEQKVKVLDIENITNALKDTVSGNKIIKIAIQMLEDKELNSVVSKYNHPLCVECTHYKENIGHVWGFCQRVGNEPVENTWYCAGFEK